jgi:hypothetical protein
MAQDRGISLKRYAIQTNEWNISVHNIWLHTKPDQVTKIPDN